MTNPRPGKERARASRLRKKVREGLALSTEDADFLETYNKEVGGVEEDTIIEEETSNEDPFQRLADNAVEAQLEISDKEPVSTPVSSDTAVSKEETKSVAKRVSMVPVGAPISVECKIAGCPCKRQSSGVYCPVLKRKVYPNFGREMSSMYARGVVGFIKFIAELFPNVKAVDATADELITLAMGLESLQKNWDQLAAISEFINPIFALVALASYVKRTFRPPQVAALPA